MDVTSAVAVLAGSGVLLAWAAVRSRADWGEPGARALTALMATLALAAVAMAVSTEVAVARLVAFSLVYHVVPVAFALFAFGYTGRYRIASRRGRAALASPAPFMIVCFFGFSLAVHYRTGVSLGAVDPGTWYVVIDAATGAVRSVLGVVYVGTFLGMFYLLGLLLVATIVLVTQALRYEHLRLAVGGSLTAGGIGPWVALMTADTVATVADLNHVALEVPVAAGFAMSAVAFAGLRLRHDPFAVAPAAGTTGPERVLEDLPEPVVVLDHDGQVIRLNPAAADVFDPEVEAVGASVEALLNHDLDALRDASPLALDGAGGQRHYEPSVSAMTDHNGKTLGYTVVLRDVTDRELRQQRLAVLNRVLRHNLRNDVTAIRGRAELLAAGDADPTEVGETITERADDLVALGDRAREIEEMLSVEAGAEGRCDLSRIVDGVVDDLGTDAVDVSVSVPAPCEVGADDRILTPVVRNLVVNGVDHNDRERPSLTITATREDGPLPVRLRVEDDGPGLPENERAAIDGGREDPLNHSRGLGLWAVKWGVTRIGGRLSLSDNDPRGTVAEVRLPTPDSAAGDAASVSADAPDGYDVVTEGAAGIGPVDARDADLG